MSTLHTQPRIGEFSVVHDVLVWLHRVCLPTRHPAHSSHSWHHCSSDINACRWRCMKSATTRMFWVRESFGRMLSQRHKQVVASAAFSRSRTCKNNRSFQLVYHWKVKKWIFLHTCQNSIYPTWCEIYLFINMCQTILCNPDSE